MQQKDRIFNLFIFLIACYFLGVSSVNAASLSLSKSSANVSVGSTIKITAKISGGLAYTYSNFSISYDQERFSFVSSSDNCNGLNCLIEGNSSVTLTFKAKSQGSATFRASGSFEDDTSGSLSASTNVTVGTKEESKTLNSNNNLKSLTIEGYDINPEFNKDTLEYSLELPGDITSVNINATLEDSSAKITGIGQIDLTEGINVVNVEVTAENGSKKTYIIKISVEEKDPIKTKINGKEYVVVRNKDNLEKPENYEEITINIDGKEVPAFYNEITKYTLVGLKNPDGKIDLYIYNESKKTYKLYKEVKFSGVNFYPMDITKGKSNYNFSDYKKYTININGLKIKVYKLKEDSSFAIVYGMNVDNGKENYYLYDIKNKTIQLYDNEHVEMLYKQKELYSLIILTSWGMLILFLIIIISLSVRNSKRKKKIKNILDKLSKEEKASEIEEDIINEEKIVNEVLEDEDEEMYNILDEKVKKKKSKE